MPPVPLRILFRITSFHIAQNDERGIFFRGRRFLTRLGDKAVPIRILIVDDHAVVRQGLKMFLKADHDLHIVGEAGDGAEAVRLALEFKPDVVLMDMLMPVMDGITATNSIRRALPDTEVLALTSVLEHTSINSAIRAGAIGYLLKDTQAADLRRAIKAAAEHQVQLSPAVAAQLVRQVKLPDATLALTERETEVLVQIGRGMANKDIARALSIGEETVKSHVSNLLSKLNLTSRTQAALYARRVGLIKDEDAGSLP